MSLFKRPFSENLLVLLTILAIFLSICFPLVNGNLYGEFDLREQFIPWRMFYSLSLEQKELGLWNPYLLNGYNHHGEGQSGLFHPFHFLLYKLFPLQFAVPVEMFAYFPFAFLGMYFFLKKSLQLVTLSSLFGSGLFSFSTFFFAHFPHVNLLWVYAHLPWLIFAFERCISTKQYKYFFSGLFSVLLASTLHFGHPQMVWMTFVVLGFATLYVIVVSENANEIWKSSLLVLTGFFAGFLIGLLQILPTAIYFLNSARNQLSEIERTNFSLHPLNFLTNLSPFLFHDRSVGDFIYKSFTDYEFLNSHQEFPSYLGLGALTLITSGIIIFWKRIVTRPERKTSFLIAMFFVFSLVLSLGKYGGLDRILLSLPLVGKFRCPGRYISLTMFFVAIIASIFVHLLYKNKKIFHLSLPSKIALTIPLVATLLLMFFGLNQSYISFRGTRLYFENAWFLSIGPVIAALTLLLILLHLRQTKQTLSLICCLCLLDIFAYGFPFLYNSEMRSINEMVKSREKMKNTSHLFRHVSTLNEPIWEGNYLASGYLGISPRVNLDFFSEKDHLRLASVKFAHGTTQKFTIPDFLPRFRLVTELKHSERPIEDISRIHLETTVLCKPENGEVLSGPPLSDDEWVTLLEEKHEYLKLMTVVKSPRILVVSDRYSPDWQARVDGKERKIISLFEGEIRGIPVNPNEKIIEFFYQPKAVQWGIGFASAGMIMVALLFLQSIRMEILKPKARKISK